MMIDIFGMQKEEILGNIMPVFLSIRYPSMIEKQEKLKEKLQDLDLHLHQHYLQMENGLYMVRDLKIKLP